MKTTIGLLTTGLVLGSLLLAACGGDEGGDSVAGTYDCGIEGETPVEVWELSDDGTLTVTPQGEGIPPAEGTWTAEGDQVTVSFEGAENDPFDVEGDRLVFAGPPGPEGTWVCTRAS